MESYTHSIHYSFKMCKRDVRKASYYLITFCASEGTLLNLHLVINNWKLSLSWIDEFMLLLGSRPMNTDTTGLWRRFISNRRRSRLHILMSICARVKYRCIMELSYARTLYLPGRNGQTFQRTTVCRIECKWVPNYYGSSLFLLLQQSPMEVC